MSISVALFFASLIGIIVMIGRKRSLVKGREILDSEEVLFEIPDVEKIKHQAVKHIKKYGHLSLVEIIRLSIRISNLLKSKYEEIKVRIRSRNKDSSAQKRGISKFLKMISNYKRKIRKIKQRIYEEEENS